MKNQFDEFELDKMRNDPTNYIGGVFYFNKKDYRIILPKRSKMFGWIFNFAKVQTYLVLIGFFLVCYLVARIA